MTKLCTNCGGTGLVGNTKETPWVHNGPLSTCAICGGRGKINEDGTKWTEEAVAVPVQAPEVAPVATEPSADINVDVADTGDISSDEQKSDDTNTDEQIPTDTNDSNDSAEEPVL